MSKMNDLPLSENGNPQVNSTKTIPLTPFALRAIVNHILDQDTCLPRYAYLATVRNQVATLLGTNDLGMRMWIHRLFLEHIGQIEPEKFSGKFGDPVDVNLSKDDLMYLPEWRHEIIEQEKILGELDELTKQRDKLMNKIRIMDNERIRDNLSNKFHGIFKDDKTSQDNEVHQGEADFLRKMTAFSKSNESALIS